MHHLRNPRSRRLFGGLLGAVILAVVFILVTPRPAAALDDCWVEQGQGAGPMDLWVWFRWRNAFEEDDLPIYRYVDWGDGHTEEVTSSNRDGDTVLTHTYETEGQIWGHYSMSAGVGACWDSAFAAYLPHQ